MRPSGKLETCCRKALAQIDERKYAEGLVDDGMKTIVKYGGFFIRRGVGW